jgi:hypothetical protein
MEINGANLTDGGQLWQIADSDLMAYNEYSKNLQVVIEEQQLQDISTELVSQPLSINTSQLSTK